MTWIRDHTRPLDLVCAPDVPAARWIPVLAHARTTVPLRPGGPHPDGVCAVRISLSGLLPPGGNEEDTDSLPRGPGRGVDDFSEALTSFDRTSGALSP